MFLPLNGDCVSLLFPLGFKKLSETLQPAARRRIPPAAGHRLRDFAASSRRKS